MSSLLEQMIGEDVQWLTSVFLEDGKKIKGQIDGILFNFESFIKTGDSSYLEKELGQNKSAKENFDAITAKKRGRPKRGVLAEINEQDNPVNVDSIKIKTEKISDVFFNNQNISTQISQGSSEGNINLNSDVMPPPNQVLPRKRKIKREPVDSKRSTRTKRKPERYTFDDESVSKESDVIIQNPKISTIDVTNDDKEITLPEVMLGSKTSNAQKKPEEVIRSKRTKTIKKADTEPNISKLMSVDHEEKVTSVMPLNNPNVTFTTNSNSNLINNCTVVLEKCNLIDEVEASGKQTPRKQKKNEKEIFSPYETVSTKKKVEAFEKLTNSNTTTPVASDKKANNPKTDKEGSKYVTPMGSKILTKTNSTTKINKYIHRENPSSDKKSLTSTKSQSALKASQAEFRERLKKKQEKEQEALKKREALLLALTEEKRKKREEKQLKAQQQREILEKEKLKLMEMQKLKEEKYKQTLIEKEGRVQQQKEEVRKRDEEIKMRERNLKLQSGRPIYMTTPAPLLPTDDCFDSDDEESERVQQIAVPSWSRDRELRKMQLVILKIGETIKNTFFCRQIHTPNLQEIFEEIDPRKLKRTSSAIWRKPPRYTFFLESSTVQFSEDDEN